MAENRRRNRKRKGPGAGFRSTWGSLFSKTEQAEEFSENSSFYSPEEEEEEKEESRFSLLRELWQRINLWAILAALLFLLFTGLLAHLVLQMWTPQPLNDIAGFAERGGRAEDLAVRLDEADGHELVIYEGELNRYLKETCRMRQTGLFSIIAHAQAVGVRIHDGYAELVIDRVLGANFHQTTSAHISFTQKMEHGRPTLRAEFRGGAPILGSMPRGGRIGRLAIPQRHIQMLQPALETMLACYPNITQAIEKHGYLPVFIGGKAGEEGKVRLVPHTPQQ